MLGELYRPKGLAYETASCVLEKDNVHACNVAWGCTNQCKDCYIRYSKPGQIRFPKEIPWRLVEKQLNNGLKTDGVFISFETDPLLQCNIFRTTQLVVLLKQKNIPTAVLSKMGAIPVKSIRHGMTIKSADEKFRKEYESNAVKISERLKILRVLSNEGEYTWVSDEPHPCPAIYQQNDLEFWESINFVDFIIFGKWNYNPLANREDSRKYYAETVPKFIDFCKDHGIRYHVKEKTMEFIRGVQKTC